MPRFSICLIIIDIWHDLEYALGITYGEVLNMVGYCHNNINIVSNIVILEFLCARFIYIQASSATNHFFLFLKRARRYKNNES